MKLVYILCLSLFAHNSWTRAVEADPKTPWHLGAPIVTYWCGPSLTDAVAK